MVANPELIERVKQGIATRERTTEQEGLRGLTRVEITRTGLLTAESVSPAEPEFVLVTDEPEERGGENKGPGPLVYFLTGVGTCFLTQLVRLGVARDLDVEFKSMRVRGERERRVGGRFLSIVQEVEAEGAVSEDDLRKLAEDAEEFCYLHTTLRLAVTMVVVVKLNGREVVRRESGPES